MTRDILLDLLSRQPFKALHLTLSNDRVVTIDDPAGVRVGRNYLVVPGESDSGGGSLRKTITLHHVLCVESESEPKLEAYEIAAAEEGEG